jgi:hypothetical protein
VSDAQIQLINATIVDVKRKIEELTMQNYQFLTDIPIFLFLFLFFLILPTYRNNKGPSQDPLQER